MRKSKRYPNVDELPLQLSDSISGYEKKAKRLRPSWLTPAEQQRRND
jgi:hypothetical protein